MNTLRSNLFDFIFHQGQKKLITGIFICLVISSFIGIEIPIVISNLFASISQPNFVDVLIFPFLLFILEYGNRVCYQIMINKFVQRVMARGRLKTYSTFIYSHQLIREDQKLQKNKIELTQGEVLARTMSDTEAIRELISSGSFSIIIDTVFILSTLLSFMKIHLQLGVILISAEILAVLLLIYGGKSMTLIFLKVRQANGRMSRVVANLSGGFNELYFTPHKNYAFKKGEVVFDDFLQVQLKSNVWDASYYSLAESLFPLFLTLLVLISPWVELKEMIVVGLMIDLIQRSIGPIKSVTGKISGLGRAYSGMKRIDEFIQEMASFSDRDMSHEKEISHLKMKGIEIVIDGFEYPERVREGKEGKEGKEESESATEKKNFKLSKISFEGNVGQLIGIVGPSGHGKSTLLKILALDLVPKNFEFRIYLDQIDNALVVKSSDLKTISNYKRFISLVSQDSHIFSESLEFNITLDLNEDKEVKEKFKKFWKQVEERIPYIQYFKFSPETRINPKELSLGQKQLLSALRALYHTRPIVLFDEVSSGLDSFLEASLRQLVLLLQKSSLTIIVSHRVETLTKANQIIVVEKGRLEAKGRHEELLSTSKIYQEFIRELPTSC